MQQKLWEQLGKKCSVDLMEIMRQYHTMETKLSQDLQVGVCWTNSLEDANQARKWSTQAREDAAWYQNEEVGYNYRMSNVIAGVIRDQYNHLSDHIAQKKAIYDRYREGLKDLPIQMNPFDDINAAPNYWLSCLLINENAMCKQVRSETEALYITESGKSCPSEILDALSSINVEGRPIWNRCICSRCIECMNL